MSAREIRRDDVVRSKITGRTGPVLRVEQYDDGTPRIIAELTKGYDTGVPGHHLELIESADDGRVHDVAEAERQAYEEDALRAAWPRYESIRDDIARQNVARLVYGASIIRRVLDEVAKREPAGEPADVGEDDVDRVDPEDPTSMVVPVPGDRVLMADGGTARVTARRMDGDVLSLQVQRPRMGYAEWVGVEAIAEISEPEDDASATVETVGDSGDGDSVALHESQHVALDGQDRTHRDCCVAGAVALGGHEVADGLDAHAYSGEQIPPLRDQLAQLHDEIRRPIHHMDSSSVGPEAATSGNPLIVEVNPGLASGDSSADRTGRDVPLVVSSQAGLSAIRHGVVPMDDAAGVLELAHEVVRAAHRWADTELDVPWVHDDERQRAARAGSRELRAAVRAHRAAGGAS